METQQPQRRTILRKPAVCKRVGQSAQAVDRGVKNGTFPAPVQLGLRSIGWYEDEVDAWIAARPRVAKGGPERGNPAVVTFVAKPKRGRGKPRLTLVPKFLQRLTSPPDST
jgi:prophage regulatory protein